MAEATEQQGASTDTGDNANNANGAGEQAATGTESKPAATATAEIDLAKLPADQLTKVLENPELYNLPRIKELREAQTELKKLQDAQQKASDEKLKGEKKFEELSQLKEAEVERLQTEVKTMRINQALSAKLVGEGVVDLDAAIKLADASKINVDDNGIVSGIEDVITTLKTERKYLFNAGNQSLGNATNSTNGGTTTGDGTATFKRSQITPEFYAANKEAIEKAYAAGTIEDDGPAPN